MPDSNHSPALEALLESEARFRATFERAPVGLAHMAPDGRWLGVNRRFLEFLGYSREEFARLRIPDFTHPDDLAASLRELDRVLRGVAPAYRLEKRYLRKNGSVVWGDLTVSAVRTEGGAAGYLIGAVEDITGRRLAQEALRHSEALFRAAFDQAAVGMLQVAPDGRLLRVNRRLCEMLGYAPGELEGRDFREITHPDDLAEEIRQARRLLSGEIGSFSMEKRYLHRDGGSVWVELTKAVSRSPTGEVDAVIAVASDITERRRAEAERRRLEAELQHAQKMESIGRLASGIAHDFNNLLTAILTNTELVLAELPEGELRRDVEAIRHTTERAAALTRHLLTFSRKRVIEPRLLDVNPLVREAEGMLRPLLGREIALRLDLADSVGPVLADAAQFEQVLLNLSVNARDAMPGGGSLTLRTREMVVDETFAQGHKGLRAGWYVTVTVEDTGSGMTPEVEARIFEPFFTTKAVGKGTGLGLSIVYGIAKQWGGYVAVASRPGAGTAFTLYLPRQEGRLEAAGVEPAWRLPGGTETILLVEDEAEIRLPVKRILSSNGYTVLEAVEGREAIRLLKEVGGIDLVLTDFMMPGITGRGLIAEMHHLPERPRILVMSGYDEQAALQGEPLPPGVGFLEKPFTAEGLLRSVRAALAGG